MIKIFALVLVGLFAVASGGPEDRFKNSCTVKEAFQDPIIGTIDFQQDIYCKKESFSSRVGVTCCRPSSPKDIGLKFILHCKNHPDGKEIFWDKDEESIIEAKTKVWYLIHGWNETPKDWPNQMADAILKKDPDAEVIVVDWSIKSLEKGWMYFQSTADLRTMGAMIGSSIIRWKVEEKTILVGQSMGAQVIGEAGRYVDLKGNGKQIEHCIGLDPAQPLFDYGDKKRRLDKGDCKLVEVIHSNSGPNDVESIDEFRLGTSNKSGNCDYWVNCGSDQGPNCGFGTFGDFIKDDGSPNKKYLEETNPQAFCSHTRAPKVLISSISGSCEYKVQECKDCGQGVKKFNTCSKEDKPMEGRSLPPFNSGCTPKCDVNFYVSSSENEPYCNE